MTRDLLPCRGEAYSKIFQTFLERLDTSRPSSVTVDKIDKIDPPNRDEVDELD